jgi:hypothetical protein
MTLMPLWVSGRGVVWVLMFWENINANWEDINDLWEG